MKDFSLGIYLGVCSGEVRMHLRMKVEAIGLGLGNKAVGPSCEIENADREPLQHRIITSYPCRLSPKPLNSKITGTLLNARAFSRERPGMKGRSGETASAGTKSP